jgi:2-iminobutanoate/2-iminopropanoate deaminase
MKKIIATPKAPAAIGPYSQAVRAGDLLFVSGQIPLKPDGSGFAGDDIASQTRQSLENIKAILEEADYAFADVVKATVYLKNIADFAAMNTVYAEYFQKDCPARAAFAVADLPKAALVEIEVVAYQGAAPYSY